MPEPERRRIEPAHLLSEHSGARASGSHEVLEIIAAFVLAIVAVATAWSGYQAALWTGHQAELYGVASKLRIQAEMVATIANEERLHNASTVVEWLKAETGGKTNLPTYLSVVFFPSFVPHSRRGRRRIRSTILVPPQIPASWVNSAAPKRTRLPD